MTQDHQTIEKTKAGNEVTIWGLVINLLLGIAKVIAGVFFGSRALLADGMHSLLDLISDAAVLFALYWSSRPEDETHHYGHHKFSSFAQLFIGVLIFVFAAGLVMSIFIGESHLTHPAHLSGLAIVIAVASLLVKEGLFWWTRSVALKIRSELIMANAWHHRSDAITSAFAFVGISIAVYMGPGYETADDWAALIASGFIYYNAFLIFRPALGEVMDEHFYDDMVEDIRKISKNVEGVVDTEKCLVRKTGLTYHVDLHMIVDKNFTVKEGHTIAHRLKKVLIREIPEISDVLIHMEPD